MDETTPTEGEEKREIRFELLGTLKPFIEDLNTAADWHDRKILSSEEGMDKLKKLLQDYGFRGP